MRITPFVAAFALAFGQVAGAQTVAPGTQSINSANPTATAADTAVNGTAATYMTSDSAPAIQKATSGQFGIVKVDGTTITAAAGVISAAAGSGCTVSGTTNGVVTYNGASGCNVSAKLTATTAATATPALTDTNTWIVASTPVPTWYLNGGASTPSFSSTGTGFGINAPSGFTGKVFDTWLNGVELFNISNNGSAVGAANIFAGAASQLGLNGRGVLTSTGSNELKVGPADSAAPSAQTINTSGSRGGTDSNIGGANLTIVSGLGTGTGTGSTLSLQTPAQAASGTTQQTAQTVLSIDGNQHIKFSSAAVPTAGTGTSAVTANSTDAAGSFTTGTSVTSAALNFKIAYATAPFCVVADQTNNARLTSYTVSTSAITATMTSNTNDVIQYICHGA